jgi:hypothetical protein
VQSGTTVLCADEKIVEPGMGWTHPSLPWSFEVPERHSHDDVRQGTTTSFPALDLAMKEVMGKLHRPPCSSGFPQLQRTIGEHT